MFAHTAAISFILKPKAKSGLGPSELAGKNVSVYYDLTELEQVVDTSFARLTIGRNSSYPVVDSS